MADKYFSTLDSSMQFPMDETLDVIKGMCIREKRSYLKHDYYQGHNFNDIDVPNVNEMNDNRIKMIHWYYEVVNYCNFSRNNVEIAISYIDRFLMTHNGQIIFIDENKLQLAYMTALYTAIKIHELNGAFSPKLVSTFLSHNKYTIDEIVNMEMFILNSINWNMNPPITNEFIQLLLLLIPNSIMNTNMIDVATHLSEIQSEIAIADYTFISSKASIIAYSALINSIESMCLFNCEELHDIKITFTEAIGITHEMERVKIQSIQQSLKKAITFHNHPHSHKHNINLITSFLIESPSTIDIVDAILQQSNTDMKTKYQNGYDLKHEKNLLVSVCNWWNYFLK